MVCGPDGGQNARFGSEAIIVRSALAVTLCGSNSVESGVRLASVRAPPPGLFFAPLKKRKIGTHSRRRHGPAGAHSHCLSAQVCAPRGVFAMPIFC